MKPIYILCFFKAVHSYFIQLFGIFQSKLSGSIMEIDLDIVNPEEKEEGLESSESLRRHVIIQSGEKLNKCKQCKFACSHQITLRRHLKKHSGEKSNKCNQCEFACSNPSSSERHFQIHSGKK